MGCTAHGSVNRLRLGLRASDLNIGKDRAVSGNSVVIRSQRSANIEFSGNSADVSADYVIPSISIIDPDRDITVVIIRDIAAEDAGFLSARCRGHSGFRSRYRCIFEINPCCAGTGNLTLVVEGAVSAPAVHAGIQIVNGDGRAVFTGDTGSWEETPKAGHRIFTAVRADEGPAQGLKHVGACYEGRFAANFSVVLICRVLGNVEIDLGLLLVLIWCRHRAWSRRRGYSVLQCLRLRYGENLGLFLLSGKNHVAVSQAGQIFNFILCEPVKTGAASLHAR